MAFLLTVAALLVVRKPKQRIEDRIVRAVLTELKSEAWLALELRSIVLAAVAVSTLHVMLRVATPVTLTIPESTATLVFAPCTRGS